MSVSFIRRIASPKKALTAAAVAAATAGMALTAAPAHAAPASASSAQAIAHQMIPDAAQFNAFSKIVEHESGW
ncbi:lytic transglycosylase domain-containing protein, partial [Streptomyces cinerochromogenes]